MTAELTTLSRKIDLVIAKTDVVLAKFDELWAAGKPGMTQRAFAKLIKQSPRTVARMVKSKRIRLEKGRVPHSEARKFLS